MTFVLILSGIVVVVLLLKLMKGGLSTVDKGELLNLIKSGALIVDVRSADEFGTGHYKGAKNIPLDKISSRLKDFGVKDANIIVYCKSGGRSMQAKSILETNGFTKVSNGGGLSNMQQLQ